LKESFDVVLLASNLINVADDGLRTAQLKSLPAACEGGWEVVI